jgi:hypothetical protein
MLVEADNLFSFSISRVMKSHQYPIPESCSRLFADPCDRQDRTGRKREALTIMTRRHATNPERAARKLAAQPIDRDCPTEGATSDEIKRAFAAKSFEVAFYYSCGELENLWRRTPLAWLRCAKAGICALMQTCPPKTFQVVFTITVALERHVFGDPSKRNVGLRAAKIV